MTRYLDSNELAEALGMNPQTIRRLAREKKIPAIRISGVWRFSQAAIAALGQPVVEQRKAPAHA